MVVFQGLWWRLTSLRLQSARALMLPLFTGAFFDDMEKVEWPRGARDPPRGHLPACPVCQGTHWLPCLCGVTSASPEGAQFMRPALPPQHCSSPVYQVGTNESPVPRPSVLTGDPGEGEAQMAPPRSPMHCVPCALQTPGAGLPGEAEPPAIRGGGGTRAVLGAGPAAEGRAGGGLAAPAGGGNGPPREADPGPEGRGGRVLTLFGPPSEKREATLSGGRSSTPTPS